MKVLDYSADLLKKFFESRYWVLAITIALYLDIVMIIYQKEIHSITEINFQEWTLFILLSGAAVLALPVASFTVEVLVVLFHYATKCKFSNVLDDSVNSKLERGYYS